MVTEKIFKIKEIIQRDGGKYYRVYGYENKISYILGVSSFEGAKENKTFLEALDQIDTLIGCYVVSARTVHVAFLKKEKGSKKYSHRVMK